MGRTAGAKDLAPVIRRAAMGSIKRLEQRGKSLSFLIEQELEKDVLKALTALAKFNPRQVNVDTKQTIEIQEIISIVTARQKEKLIQGEVIQDMLKDTTDDASITPSFTPKTVTVEPSA